MFTSAHEMKFGLMKSLDANVHSTYYVIRILYFLSFPFSCEKVLTSGRLLYL